MERPTGDLGEVAVDKAEANMGQRSQWYSFVVGTVT